MLDILSDPKVLEQLDILRQTTGPGIWETLYSTVLATALAYVIGLPLGVILVTGEQGGIRPLPGALMKALNFIVNVLRSIPFLILMMMVIPLSRLLVGTSVGTVALIVPLVIAAFPFVARVVEGSLREMDRGMIEAAQSMGCTTFQIIWKVLLPECLPSLIVGFTTASITILSYGAMAGIIGGGGLGAIAINYGYYRKKNVVMYITVIVLVLLVQLLQSFGTRMAVRLDKRLNHNSRKNVQNAARAKVQKDKRSGGGAMR